MAPAPRIFRYEAKIETNSYEFFGELTGPDLSGVPVSLRSFVIGLDEPSLPGSCPYCESNLVSVPAQTNEKTRKRYWRDPIGAGPPVEAFGDERSEFLLCERCGFWAASRGGFGIYDGGIHWNNEIAALKSFSINDAQVTIAEVGRHLSRNVSDIYAISPRRFEQLVAEVYKDLGYTVELTQQSRDGGCDLVLLGGRSYETTLVECKRYAETRSVSVGVVRELMGVQLLHDVRHAKIVTTSRFTKPATNSAASLSEGASGFAMELIDIETLTKVLGVYGRDP